MSDEGKRFDFSTLTSLVGCSNIPGPITCIHAHKKRLFVGTARGALSMYEVKVQEEDIEADKSGSPKYYCKAELKDSKVTPSKTNFIMNIQTDPNFKYCFVLHRDPQFGVCIYDLKTLALLQQKVNAEKANFLALDKKYENKRFLIATDKPSILVYTYKHCERAKINDRRPVMIQEIPLIEQAIQAEFVGESITVVCKTAANADSIVQSYQLYTCKPGGQVKSTFKSTTWPPYGRYKHLPKIIHLDDDTVMLRAGPDTYKPQYVNGEQYLTEKQLKQRERERKELIESGALVEESKQQAQQTASKVEVQYNNISFEGGEPKDVACCFPYVAGVFNQDIEICSVYGTNASKSSDNTPSRQRFKRDLTNGLLICASNKRFYIASGAQTGSWDIFVLIPPPIKEQITQMTKDLVSKAPLHLLYRTMSSESERAQMNIFIKVLQQVSGFYCLYKARVKDAFKSFAESRQDCPAAKKLDVRDILLCYQTNESSGERPIDNFTYPVADYSFLALCPSELFTNYNSNTKYKKEHALDKEFKELVKSMANTAAQAISINIPKILTQKAFAGLLHFLEKIRNPLSPPEEDEEQFVIEFALVSLYIRRLESDPKAYEGIETIVRGPNKFNSISNQIAQQRLMNMLKDFGLIRHQSLLYRSMGPKYYLKALEKLKKNSMEKELFHDKYDGVEDAIDILSQIEGDALLDANAKEYLSMVINKAPTKAIRVFTAPRVTRPDTNKVLDFLSSYPLEIKQQYLYYTIYDQNDVDPKHHTEYALALIENLSKIFPRQGLIGAPTTTTEGSNTTAANVKLWTNTIQLNPLLRIPAGEENGLLGQYRKQLLQHLAQSNLYNREEVLDKLKDTVLFEEQVELFRKMNKHYDSLMALLFSLRDPIAAEQYCVSVYEQEKILSKSETLTRRLTSVVEKEKMYNPYFITFTQAFVDGWQMNPSESVQPLLDMLNEHAHEIDACEAMENLPDDLPLKGIEPFLTQSIQYTHNRIKTSLLKRSIVRTSNQDILTRNVKATHRKLMVTSHTACVKCEQLIGDSVFAVFPDMSAVHYKCLLPGANNEKEKHIHPRTRNNFKFYPQNL